VNIIWIREAAMNFASPETTNIMLAVMAFVALGQFVVLLAVIVALRSTANRARAAVSLAQGDMDRLRTRLDRLLSELETLVAHGNAVLGSVERGAKDIGSAASAVGYSAQRAMEVGSFEVRAVTAAVKTGLQWFLQSPWGQRWRHTRPTPAPGAPSRLDPDIAAR
jgi:hypothetical protein